MPARTLSLQILLRKRLGVLLALCAASAVIACAGSIQEDEYVALPTSSFAGLKAGMACSAVFVAGRSLEDVLVDELSGLPAAAAGAADPEIDRVSRSVSVAYGADSLRVAVYRPGRGCTILPPGAGPELVRAIPNPEIDRSTRATALQPVAREHRPDVERRACRSSQGGVR